MSRASDAIDGTPVALAPGDIVERLLALSAQALEALETSDLDAVHPILAEREQLIAASSEEAGAHAGASGRPPGDLLPLLERLRRSDARLALALASKRDEIRRHLAALDSRGAARSAYGPLRRPPASINAVR